MVAAVGLLFLFVLGFRRFSLTCCHGRLFSELTPKIFALAIVLSYVAWSFLIRQFFAISLFSLCVLLCACTVVKKVVSPVPTIQYCVSQ